MEVGTLAPGAEAREGGVQRVVGGEDLRRSGKSPMTSPPPGGMTIGSGMAGL